MKKISLTFFLLIHYLAANSQNFYDLNTIQDIYITFAEPNWDYILDTMHQNYSTNRLIAQVVSINGVSFDSVGVSYKGNSSYNANNAKNPLHLELDYAINNQNYAGYQDLKLSNGSHDPTFVREVLSYDMLKNYVPISMANYTRVYINGNFHGLYGNIEAVNKQFANRCFYDNNGAFFMCDAPDGTPQPTPAPNLSYLSADSTAYFKAYTLESDNGWNKLVNLCDKLNNSVTSINQYLNIDRALWMLSFNNLFVNLDSYTGSIGHNYYIYNDINNQFNTIIWDLNESFGRFANAGTGGQLTFAQMKNLDPLLHATSSARPLIKQLLSNSTYRKMYMAHLRTMLNEMVVTDYYKTRAYQIQAIIDADYQTDPNKFFSYNNFTSNVLNDVSGGGGPGGTAIGLASLMDARKTFLLSNAEIIKTPPTISNIMPSPSNPNINTAVTITANIGLPATNVILGYRYATWQKFTQIPMLDNGLNNDGAAGDGIFGATIPPSPSAINTQYYLYAENNNAGIFSPQRAEHEFYTLNYTIPPSPVQAGNLVINEFMASNLNYNTDNAGEYNDWIELYNPTNTTQPLYGLYLSDDPLNPQKWDLPIDVSIAPNNYLIIWADEDSIQGNLHANFKLSKSGETIKLLKANGTVIDSVQYGLQANNITTGRYPNGTGNFVPMPPTFSSQNALNTCANSPLITGNVAICQNNNYTYSVISVPGASYFWNVINGTITSGQGTNQISVQWNNNGAGSITITQINP